MERAETTDTLSSPIRFLLSVLALALVAGAVLVNFGLLAGAYGVMIGGTKNIGGLTAAEAATLVFIFVELNMGLFLTESRGITNLWLRRTLPEEICSRMFWITLLIIGSLALTGAGLIYLEDLLLAKGTAIGAGGSVDVLPVSPWARMALAFVLPFAIALWAIPFEALLRVFRAPRV